MSLSQWFATQRAALRKRDEAKAQNYMRLFEKEEQQRNYQHDHDLSGQRAHSTRPQDPVPRGDAVAVKTRNDGSKRSSR